MSRAKPRVFVVQAERGGRNGKFVRLSRKERERPRDRKRKGKRTKKEEATMAPRKGGWRPFLTDPIGFYGVASSHLKTTTQAEPRAEKRMLQLSRDVSSRRARVHHGIPYSASAVVASLNIGET